MREREGKKNLNNEGKEEGSRGVKHKKRRIRNKNKTSNMQKYRGERKENEAKQTE